MFPIGLITEMSQFLLGMSYTAFSAPLIIPPVRRMGVHKKLGVDTARTAETMVSCSVHKAGRKRRQDNGLEW